MIFTNLAIGVQDQKYYYEGR
jgi:hypothetical protein